jgi:hypothetical protein
MYALIIMVANEESETGKAYYKTYKDNMSIEEARSLKEELKEKEVKIVPSHLLEHAIRLNTLNVEN